MFHASTYSERRKKLREILKNGIFIFVGNTELPMNYPANIYHFRQDSTFLYFFGIDEPGLAAIIDIDNDKEIIFGNDIDIEDIIWTGPLPKMEDKAVKVDISITKPFAEFETYIKNALKQNRKIHFLPPYNPNSKIFIGNLLDIPIDKLKESASMELIHAVIALRSIKSSEEVAEIEKGIDVAYDMFTTGMKLTREGKYEYEVYGAMEGIALANNGGVSFPIILSVRGEVLHGHEHCNIMKNGNLLLMDAGFETPMRYATDHTRTIPVSGKFSQKQKEIYQVVLDAQIAAIEAIKPGIKYQDVHLLACRVIADGLKNIGLMQGNIEEAVEKGAHALFFPHGLGHMMGMDVHDMEDIGQIYVGYDQEVRPINQFGTAYLRLGRRLQPGFVLTVEPGIYFIPELFNLWKSGNKFSEYINYNKVREYLDFGGIRLEDDILVTDSGYHVLGRPIPKSITEIENLKG